MNELIIDWVVRSTSYLIELNKDHFNRTLLIKSHVTQYELLTNKYLENKKIFFLNDFHYSYARLKNKFGNKKNKSEYSNLTYSNKDVIFWPYQKIHLDFQSKIINQLKIEKNISYMIVSNNDRIYNNIKNISNECLLDNCNDIWFDYKNDENCRTLLEQSKRIKPLIIDNNVVLFEKILKCCFIQFYSGYRSAINFFNEISLNFTPKIIFIGNYFTQTGNIVSHLCKKDNISVHCLMHGQQMTDYLDFTFIDNYYLFGQRDKNNFTRKGIPSNKLFVSGSPFLDTHDVLNIKNNNSNIVLICFSGPGHSITLEHHIMSINLIFKLAKYYDDLQFIIKLHRKDKLKYYVSLNKLMNVSFIEYNNNSKSIYEFISKSKLVITGASSSALDSMVLNVPVITLDLMGHLRKFDFIKNNITLHAENFNMAIDHIDTILNQQKKLERYNEKVKKYIKDVFFKPKQGSTKFIVDNIKKIIYSKQK
jgi:hypothetical protein